LPAPVFIICDPSKNDLETCTLLLDKIKKAHKNSTITWILWEHAKGESIAHLENVIFIKSIRDLASFLRLHKLSIFYLQHTKTLCRFEIIFILFSILPSFPDVISFTKGPTIPTISETHTNKYRLILSSLYNSSLITIKIYLVYIVSRFFVKKHSAIELCDVKKILFIRTDRLGDVAVTYPSILALRDKYPNAIFDVLASKRTASFLECQQVCRPIFSDIIIWRDVWDMHAGFVPGIKQFVCLLKQVFSLRKKQYDLVIQPIPAGVWVLLATMINPRILVSIVDENLLLPRLLAKDVDFPVTIKKGEKTHFCWHAKNCVRKIGVNWENLPSLLFKHPSEKIFYLKKTKSILLNLSAGDRVKILPLTTIERLLNIIARSYHDISIILIGVDAEADLANDLINKNHNIDIINLVGKTSLNDLVYLFYNSQILVTPDTGAMHVAALTPIKIVAYFSSGKPSLFSPINDKKIIIKHELGCSGCSDICPIHGYPKPCIEAISAQEIADAVDSFLN